MAFPRMRLSLGMGSLALACLAWTAGAIEMDVDAGKIEAALRIARGPESGRTAFHKPYLFTTTDPTVESIEIITELRRLVKIAEARIAGGDHSFSQDTRALQETMRPWRGHVSIVAHLRFHPQNSYVTAPPIDFMVLGRSGAVPPLDRHTDTLFAMASGAKRQQIPVAGATAEAVFDATAVGQNADAVIVLVNGKELARVTVDFSRLD